MKILKSFLILCQIYGLFAIAGEVPEWLNGNRGTGAPFLGPGF